MKSRVIARRYAAAFFHAIERTELLPALGEFRAFMNLWEQAPTLRTFLLNPAVPIERKHHVVDASFAKGPATLARDFLHLLVRRHRADFLTDIAEELEQLYRKKMNILGVHVQSAVPLLPSEREALLEKLRTHHDGPIDLKLQVKPEVKGGLLIFMEDRVIDSTVKRRFAQLTDSLHRYDQDWLDGLTPAPARP